MSYTFVTETTHPGVGGLPSKPASRARTHICEVCSKHFKRSEHLLRHVRAHRQERPFSCRYCPKGFARRDLLTRHEKTLHAAEYEEVEGHSRRGPRKASQRRDTQSSSSPKAVQVIDFSRPPDDVIAGETDETCLTEDVVRDSPQACTPTQHAAIVAEPEPEPEPSVTSFNAQAPMTPFASSFELRFPPNQDTNMIPGTETFCQTFDSVMPSNINGNLCQQSLGLDPSTATLENVVSPRPSSQRVPDQFQSFTMPPDLESLDFFSTLDDSLFTQASFPTEMMDFELSPQSFGGGGGSSIPRIDDPGSTGEDVPQTCAMADPVVAREAPDQSNRPVDHPQRPRRRSAKPKWATINDAVRALLLEDLRTNYTVSHELVERLPSSRMLDNFLWKFFQCFQRHLPIFHVPSFNPATTQAPLLLAMCSIGALYSLNRKHAGVLRLVASNAIDSTRQPKYTGHPCPLEPLWKTQCNTLIVFGAMFGSNLRDASDGISELGSFMQPYALRRAMISRRAQTDRFPSWEAWIDYELTKRLLCGIYIASSLNSATYDLAPGFAGFRDLNFPVPADEALWEAPTREEWQRLIDTQTQPMETLPTITAVSNHLVYGDETAFRFPNHATANIGAFATTTVMHAVNIHMYYLSQSVSSATINNADPDIAYALRLSRNIQTERALSRCQEFLKTWQLSHDDSDSDSQPHRHEESFIFNCQALLRLSYVRVFSGMQCFNRACLLYEDPADVETAVTAYVTAPQSRGAFLTKAAEQVMFCFTAPIRAGHMLIRKTAAFTWSIEHAVASWDCTLFLSKWIHTVESEANQNQNHVPMTKEEQAIFDILKEALHEADSPYDGQRSLAAQVTRTWSMFMDDVWVWEVTVRMGAILRQLADVYDASWRRQLLNKQIPESMTL